MLTLTKALACVLTLTAAMDGCNDKPEDTDTDPAPPPPPPPVTETFDATVDGVKDDGGGGGLSSSHCAYDFDVDEIPEDGDDEEIVSCALTFALSGELSDRSELTLEAPGGATIEIDRPTLAAPTVEVPGFVGTGRVDGKWSFASDNRGDCQRIDGIQLILNGEYTATAGS